MVKCLEIQSFYHHYFWSYGQIFKTYFVKDKTKKTKEEESAHHCELTYFSFRSESKSRFIQLTDWLNFLRDFTSLFALVHSLLSHKILKKISKNIVQFRNKTISNVSMQIYIQDSLRDFIRSDIS